MFTFAKNHDNIQGDKHIQYQAAVILVHVQMHVKYQDHLVIEFAETPLQVERTGVGEFGKNFEMGNQLPVGGNNIIGKRTS